MTLRLNGDSSGFTEIKAPNAAGDNSITLPANNGSVNELLKNSGTAGTLEYASGVTVNGLNRLGVQTADPQGHVHVTSSYGGNPTNSGDNQCALVLESSATAAQFAGPSLLFRGQTGNSTPVYGFGGIQGFKASTDSNNYTGGLRFFAQNSGGATVHQEVFRYSPAGISLIQGGINFAGIQSAAVNGASMTSETLDAYEEGTWTPDITNSGVTWLNDEGVYTRIGRLVNVSFWLRAAGTSSSTGAFSITGLPFASTNTTARFTGATRLYNVANYTGRDGSVAWMSGSAQVINVIEIDGNGIATATSLNHNIWQTGAELHFTMSYITG